MEEVQRRPALEPLDLRFAIGVIQPKCLRGAIGVAHDALDRLPRRQIVESDEADAVVLADAIVVRRVAER